MARKALIVKQKKLNELRERWLELRNKHREEWTPMPKVKWFQPTKYYNRCQIRGRVGSYMREFGVDRVTFRHYARKGMITGVRKASW